MLMSIPNALFWKSQKYSINDSIYNFDLVFLEVKTALWECWLHALLNIESVRFNLSTETILGYHMMPKLESKSSGNT